MRMRMTVHGAVLITGLLTAAAPLHGALAQGAPKTKAADKAAAKLDDPTIVAIFDAANTWDIETGGLAVKGGTTKDIRDFGAMLERDHTAVRKQGRDLAAKLHVTPTPPMDFGMARDHEAAMARLKGVKGAAFDRAFLEHEVAYHKAVIDAITTTLLPALQNEEVKALVKLVAPAFQAHMIAAQTMLDKLPR